MTETNEVIDVEEAKLKIWEGIKQMRDDINTHELVLRDLVKDYEKQVFVIRSLTCIVGKLIGVEGKDFKIENNKILIDKASPAKDFYIEFVNFDSA